MPKLIEPIRFIGTDGSRDISEYAVKLAALMPERTIQFAKGMNFGAETKFVEVNIPSAFSSITILHITDVQYGNPQCDVAKLKEYVGWAAADKSRFILLGGDLVDVATMLQKHSGAMEQVIGPDMQVMEICEILAPISDQIIGSVGGNHEAHGARVGHDFGLAIASNLRIPYSSGVQHINVRYGDWQPFKIYLWHGRGSARTTGAQANMICSVVPNDRANLYINGHIHTAMVIPGIHVDRIPNQLAMQMEKFYCVSSTSFLNYYGAYAERAFYKPSFTLMGAVTVKPDGTFRVSI